MSYSHDWLEENKTFLTRNKTEQFYKEHIRKENSGWGMKRNVAGEDSNNADYGLPKLLRNEQNHRKQRIFIVATRHHLYKVTMKIYFFVLL